MRLVIRRDLLELGYNVIEARDGVEADGLLKTVPDIKVLVSDVIMPGGLTGPALAARAREERPEIRIVLITGYVDGEDGQAPRPENVELLRKPLEKEQLARAIDRW